MFLIKRRTEQSLSGAAAPEVVKEFKSYQECIDYLQDNNPDDNLYIGFGQEGKQFENAPATKTGRYHAGVKKDENKNDT